MAKKRKRGKKLPSGSFAGTGGRPPKLTPEVQERIVAVLRANGYIETAASFVGISKETFHDWMRQGARAEKGIYREFSDSIKKALAEGQVRGLTNVQRAASGYDVLKTRTVTEQKPVVKPDGTVMVVNVTTTTEEKSREFAWQAAAWLLERRWPNLYGRRDHVELAGDPDSPLPVRAEPDLALVSDPLRMAKMLAAFADVQLISPAVIELIEGKDFAPILTPKNGPSPD